MLYNFSQNSSRSDWQVVDDVVMGGRSDGGFYIDENGNGVFEGKVSLENNGGFSSVRHSLHVKVGSQTKVKITLNPGLKYSSCGVFQLRVRSVVMIPILKENHRKCC